jgi:hypothetical protein
LIITYFMPIFTLSLSLSPLSPYSSRHYCGSP